MELGEYEEWDSENSFGSKSRKAMMTQQDTARQVTHDQKFTSLASFLRQQVHPPQEPLDANLFRLVLILNSTPTCTNKHTYVHVFTLSGDTLINNS